MKSGNLQAHYDLEVMRRQSMQKIKKEIKPRVTA